MGLLVVGPGGTAIDRLGARRILLGVLSLLVVGNVVLAFADHAAGGGAGACCSTASRSGVSWPASRA